MPNPPYKTYIKFGDMAKPGPSSTYVLLDEHPDSINDAAFANKMLEPGVLTGAQIIDFPASYHNGACGFSFADGHAEIRKWLGGTIKAPARYTATMALNVPAKDSARDVLWMADRTTSKITN